MEVKRKKENVNKQDSPEEIERKNRDKNKKQIKAIMKRTTQKCREFILDIVDRKIEPLKDNDVNAELFQLLLDFHSVICNSNMITFLLNKSAYDVEEEEKEKAKEKISKFSFQDKLLVCLGNSIENAGETFDWQGKYNEERGGKLCRAFELLSRYGWQFADGEEEVINGTSDLYVKEEK